MFGLFKSDYVNYVEHASKLCAQIFSEIKNTYPKNEDRFARELAI